MCRPDLPFRMTAAATLLATCILDTVAQAPTYNIVPNDTMVGVALFNDGQNFTILQQNTSGNSLQLAWVPVLVDMPIGWQYWMCDFGHCYIDIPAAGGTMDPVIPDDAALMSLHVAPGTVSGEGVVRAYVYDVNYPAQGDTLTWLVATVGQVGIAELGLTRLSVFPNPATGHEVFITTKEGSMERVRLFDGAGRMVHDEVAHGAQVRLSTAQFTKGMYSVVVTMRGMRTHTRLVIE